jgi:hypothetical protein
VPTSHPVLPASPSTSALSAAPPRPIDPRGPRFAAAVTSVVLLAVLLTGSGWLLLAQAAVFALGTVDRSPYAAFFRRFVRPRLGPPAELEDPRPVRFAQGVGLGFALLGLLGVVAGSGLLAVAAVGAALAAAVLNASVGLCLGCELYLLARRARAGRGARAAAPAAAAAPAETPDTPSTHHRTEVSA